MSSPSTVVTQEALAGLVERTTGDTGFYQLDRYGSLQGWHDIGGSSTAYAVVGVGDFNGDGVSDVLFP